MTTYCNFHLSLCVLHDVLSSIPLFALYYISGDLSNVSNETNDWFVDVFSTSDKPVTERAQKAWLFDLIIMPADMEMIPDAIQIELTHCDKMFGVYLSPFVCAYYLMFLNYRALRQYENRDCSLRQLIEAVNNREQCGYCTRVIQKVLLCTKYYVISNAYPYLVYSNLLRKVS